MLLDSRANIETTNSSLKSDLLDENNQAMWSELGQIENAYDISSATLWSFMNFRGRPSYNLDLLADFHGWQSNIQALKDEMGDALKYVVLGSRHAKMFCLGGDLDHFSNCIARRDAEALRDYGMSCVQILHRNWRNIDTDVTTIGLVQGDALGGGFESLLSFDVICAEKGAKFGFPEQMFGLFPGMGALSFLGRKLGFAAAEKFVRTGRLATAEELYDMGLVHILTEKGEGIAGVKDYISKNASRHKSRHLMHQAGKRANPLSFEELSDIVDLWVDACMTLTEHNVQVMQRLVSAQERLSKAA